MVLISAVVCTHNRCDLLTGALESLCQQTAESALYEIIVVDNASTDRTLAVVQEFQVRYPDRAIQFAFETSVGLSHARNRGWQEAQGAYVAYFDDDCTVPEGWMTLAQTIIQDVSPAVFGGPYFAFYRSPRPKWFKDSYGSWSPADHSYELDPLGKWEFMNGTNMVYRRDMLEEMGGFDPGWGMAGKKIAYGEETDLQRRLKRSHPEAVFYYHPDLYVYHLVKPEVMRLRHVVRQRFAMGITIQQIEFLMEGGPPPCPFTQMARLRVWGVRGFLYLGRQFLVESVWKSIRRDKTLYPYVQNYLFERAVRYVEKMGRLSATYRQYRTALKTGACRG